MRPYVLAGLLVGVLAAGAVAQEEAVRKTRYFDILVEDGLEIDSRTAREIENEIEAGFESACEILGVGERQVFYDGVPAPLWMGEADRMGFVVRPRVPARRAGIEVWTKQLFKGGFRMDVPYPVEGTTAEWRGRLRRAAGVTVLGNTLYRTRVPWWSEGLLTWLEAAADEEERALATRLRKVVAEIPAAEFESRIGALLAATSEEQLAEPSLEALAYVLVDLVARVRPELIARVQRQLQTMAYHLYWYPDEAVLRRDFVAMAREQWTANLDVAGWAGLVRAWADAGFPEGSDLRRLRELRELKRLDLPDPFEVTMTGHWGGSWVDDYDRRGRTWEGGGVDWRLPGTLRGFSLWVGLLERLPRGEPLEPKKLDDGAAAILDEWPATPEGRKRFPDTGYIVGYVPDHYEFSLLHAVSELGVQYRFHRYGKR